MGAVVEQETAMSIAPSQPARSLPPEQTTVRLYVNAVPPDLSPRRAIELLRQYRQELSAPSPDSPPRWYIEALIASLAPLVVETAVQR